MTEKCLPLLDGRETPILCCWLGTFVQDFLNSIVFFKFTIRSSLLALHLMAINCSCTTLCSSVLNNQLY